MLVSNNTDEQVQIQTSGTLHCCVDPVKLHLPIIKTTEMLMVMYVNTQQSKWSCNICNYDTSVRVIVTIRLPNRLAEQNRTEQHSAIGPKENKVSFGKMESFWRHTHAVNLWSDTYDNQSHKSLTEP